MSLARAILRLTAARAIKGMTFAEDRVFNSDLDPLDHRLSSDPAPIAVIFTDDHQEDIGHMGDMASGNGSVDLVIEIAIAGAVTVQGSDANAEAVEVSIGETDAGMELTIDILERQIIAALTAAEGAWATLFRRFCVKILRRASRRGGSSENGTRFAARQIILTCETLIDPPPGVVYGVGSAWADLIEAVAADPALAPIAPLLRAELGGPPVAEWRQAARILGINLNVDIGLGDAICLGEDPAGFTLGTVTGPGGTVTTAD